MQKGIYISYENALNSLQINSKDFKHMLKVFNINTTPLMFSKEQYSGFVSYLNKIGHKIPKVNDKLFFKSNSEKKETLSLEEIINNRKKIKKVVTEINEVKQPKNEEAINLAITEKVKTQTKKINVPKIKEIEVIGIIGNEQKLINNISKKDKKILLENSYVRERYDLYLKDCLSNNVIPIEFKLYKSYKTDYPILHNFRFDEILLYTDIVTNAAHYQNDLKRVKSAKFAVKLFNNGYVLYYVQKGSKVNILCKLDITKPFATNLSKVVKNYRYGAFDFYTYGERFDIKNIKRDTDNLGKVWTKEEDQKVLNFYNNSDYATARKKHNGGTTLKELAKEIGIDTKSIRDRAIKLGFVNFKKPNDKNWSPEELKLLEKCAGKYNPKKIEKIFREHGFTRGFVGIGIKLTRLGFSRKLSGEKELNLKLLSDAMGVDSHFFYENNRLEKLKAKNENNQIIFNIENVGNYLINNPYDYNLSKVEPKWFIETILSSQQSENMHE